MIVPIHLIWFSLMRIIAEATARVTGKTFSRKYIALGRIVNSWAEIVGKDLSAKTQPVKLNYIKRQNNKTPVAVLEIATSMADATLLHYQKDLILERINRLFGEGWVTAVKFVNLPANSPRSKTRPAKKPLTPQEKTYLSGILETVGDGEVKALLETLGAAIFTDASTMKSKQ